MFEEHTEGLDKRTVDRTRVHPRRRCYLRLDRANRDSVSVADVSVGGMLLAVSDVQVGTHEEGRLHLPGQSTPLPVRYEALRRQASGTSGVRFDGLRPTHRRQVQRFVEHQRSVELLKKLQLRLGTAEAANLKPLGDPGATLRTIERLADDHASVRLFRDPGRPFRPARFVDVLDGQLLLDLKDQASRLRPYDELLLATAEGETTYMADTTVTAVDGGLARVVLPERLYRPERRTDLRDPASLDGVGHLAVEVDGRQYRWPILESGAGGLSVLVPTSDARLLPSGALLAGRALPASGGRPEPIEARVAWSGRFDEGGLRGHRVGMERIVARSSLNVVHAGFEQPRGLLASAQRAVGKAAQAGAVAARKVLEATGVRARTSVDVVRYDNRRGETIVSIRNQTGTLATDEPVPVVVIPPAYGGKKEHTAALALVLVETWAKAGRPLLVVRYDSTGAIGESERGDRLGDDIAYANVDYKLSRGVDDLLDTLDHLETDPSFTLGPVAVVSFSLAAIVARRAIVEDAGRRVRCWVAPTGASDTRDVVRNSTGGIDYLGDHRRGARRGLRPVVGHLIDTEAFCEDAWVNGLADLAQARSDMRQIAIPVTWLCGSLDYWVNFRRVADVMTVEAPGSRELIVVPTGHVVRTSHEAIETFRLVATRVARDLLGEALPAVVPSADVITGTLEAERARLKGGDFDPRRYWKRYLMGDPDNPLGFDVLSLTSEYHDLVSSQVEALGARAGDRVVDLGSGTGNGSEAILACLPTTAYPWTELNLVDLVPDALALAQAKLQRLQDNEGNRARVYAHACDLSAVGPGGGMLPFGDAAVDRVMASLVLSYLKEPVDLLKDARRILRPGGRIVISSMVPDADISGPLNGLLTRIMTAPDTVVAGCPRERVVEAVQSYVNDAAGLLDLATDGVFRFYDTNDLATLLRKAGFVKVRVFRSFGEGGHAAVAVAERPGG